MMSGGKAFEDSTHPTIQQQPNRKSKDGLAEGGRSTASNQEPDAPRKPQEGRGEAQTRQGLPTHQKNQKRAYGEIWGFLGQIHLSVNFNQDSWAFFVLFCSSI
jgi:hypothetical protein